MDIDQLTTSLRRINLSSPHTVLPSSPVSTPSPPSSPPQKTSTNRLPLSTSSNITTTTSNYLSATPPLRRSGTTSIRPLLFTDATTILQSLLLLLLLAKSPAFSTSRARYTLTALLRIFVSFAQFRAIWRLCAAAWKRDTSRMSRRRAYNPYWRVACVRSVTMRLSLWAWLLMGRLFLLVVCIWGGGLWAKWGKVEDWQGWVVNWVTGLVEEWGVLIQGPLGQVTAKESVLGNFCQKVDWGVVLRERGR